MAFNAFLQITTPPVAGEATQANYAGQIEIYSFSFGASNPTTVSSGQAGLSAGKVSISSFNVMKKADKSSPPLFAACSAGREEHAHYSQQRGEPQLPEPTSPATPELLRWHTLL